MKTHVEIIVRLRLKEGETLHQVLQSFAGANNGWGFPAAESADYESGHGSEAGFVVSDTVPGLERAAVALASLDTKHRGRFSLTNIVPKAVSHLSIDQYNAIGLEFSRRFKHWLPQSGFQGSLEIKSPDRGLRDISQHLRQSRRLGDVSRPGRLVVVVG